MQVLRWCQSRHTFNEAQYLTINTGLGGGSNNQLSPMFAHVKTMLAIFNYISLLNSSLTPTLMFFQRKEFYTSTDALSKEGIQLDVDTGRLRNTKMDQYRMNAHFLGMGSDLVLAQGIASWALFFSYFNFYLQEDFSYVIYMLVTLLLAVQMYVIIMQIFLVLQGKEKDFQKNI